LGTVGPTRESNAKYNFRRWQDLPHHEDTWELADEMQTVFPQLDLENKVHHEERGY